MTQIMNETSVFDQLACGEFDTQLDQLAQAIRDRRKYVNQQRGLENAATLKPGDKVRTRGLSPKYLSGLSGVVSPRPAGKAGSLMVDIDEDQYTGRFSKHVGVPAGCLEKIS